MRRHAWTFLILVFVFPAAGPADIGHPHGEGFDRDCSGCHTVDDWKPLRSPLEFEHLSTGFSLDGAHDVAGCRDCHESLEFSQVGTACADCHADPHAGELGFDCEACHGTTVWEDQRAGFDAHSATLFPLLAPHATLECDACHGTAPSGGIGGGNTSQLPDQFATTPTDCYTCHLQDFTSTIAPNHVTAGFPTECETCHSPVAARWDEAVFLHPTTFLLDGAHARLDCEGCHSTGFAGTPTECDACHLGDYQATTDPAHAAAGFPRECETCHDSRAWTPALFDHNATGFQLRGAHQPLACETCHATGFAGTPTDCFACHRSDYQSARDPEHANAGFPTACETCHSENSWEGAEFDHAATGFVLRGRHRPLDCEACHSSGYEGTPTDCFACHRSDYQSARDPDHAGFPRTCESCHNESGWEGAVFDHNATGFVLRGRHRSVDCEACHSDGFAGTPTDCYSCHRTDYQSARDPNHVSAGFPTTCETCHKETTWDDADFDHNRTAFPLRDSHAGLDCQSCHESGYAGTPTDCFSCHADDYNRTRDPDHQSAGFPTTCETCHRPTRWEDSDWDHLQFFPIFSGKHRGEWNDCADCHVAPGNFAVFECIFCHEHRQSEMNDEHRGVSGYRWESRACLECHPDGDE